MVDDNEEDMLNDIAVDASPGVVVEDIGCDHGTGHAHALASPGAVAQDMCCEHGTGHASGSRTRCQDTVERQPKYLRVDPPTVADAPGEAVREDEAGYIAKAFPKLFPHGTGDYHYMSSTGDKLLSFPEWGRYVLMWHDGRFMRHTRFRYWLLDTVLRAKTPGIQRVFFRLKPGAADVTIAQLRGSKEERNNLVRQMSTLTSQMPGSVGERRKMRQELEAMVHQIEAETADAGENGGAGRIPAGFCTLTCPVYKWEQLHDIVLRSYDSNDEEYERLTAWRGMPRGEEQESAMRKAFYELALANPGAVAWYCGLKLEMAIGLLQAVLTKVTQDSDTPGLSEISSRVAEHIRQHAGVSCDVDVDVEELGRVDDYYASIEWSAGGLVHAHIAIWMVGSPRIDRVVRLEERESANDPIRVDDPVDGEVAMVNEDAAALLGQFWERIYTEYNVAKANVRADDARATPTHHCSKSCPRGQTSNSVAGKIDDACATDAPSCKDKRDTVAGDTGLRAKLGKKVERAKPSPESISTSVLLKCLLGRTLPDESDEDEAKCWQELDDIMATCARTKPDYHEARTPEAKRARARSAFVAALAEWVNMHDWHKPFALGPPARGQACCAVENENTTQEKYSCNKLFPRKLIDPGEEEISEDPRRRELYRLWMARNCHFMNNFVPIILMAMLSNMDFQATLTIDGVIEYMTKYMTKSGQGSLVQVR